MASTREIAEEVLTLLQSQGVNIETTPLADSADNIETILAIDGGGEMKRIKPEDLNIGENNNAVNIEKLRTQLENEVKRATDEDEQIQSDMVKLQEAVFPLILNVNISPNDLQKYTGSAKSFVITCVTSVSNETVIPDELLLTVNGVVMAIDKTNPTVTVSAANDSDIALTAKLGSRVATKNTKINFAYPAYTGIVEANFTPSSNNVKGLTEMSLADSKSRSFTYSAPKLQKIVYAYAKDYGVLSGIVDTNNINLISNYSRSEITINGIAYYVYITTQEFSTNGSITYNYK